MFGRTGLGLLSLLFAVVRAQEVLESNSILDLLKPDARITGGFQSVLDRVHALDTHHTSCGKRQLCEAMSLTEIRRSDGTSVAHKGWLRPYVDMAIGMVVKAVSPLLYRVGMGPLIAREDVTFFDFFLDIIDSSLIWAGHVLAGRQFSRQFEQIGPLRSVVSALPQPPFRHLPDMLDLAVDLTGAFNRQRGSFQYMRAGLMGYWKGGEVDEDESGICNYLYTGDEGTCDSYWAMIPHMNNVKTTEALRQGPSNPLANTPAYKFSGFEWKDLANPKYVFCKVDNYLSSVHGHVSEEPLEDVIQLDVDDVSNIVIVRKLDNETDEDMKMREKDECVKIMETEMESKAEEEVITEGDDYDYEDEEVKVADEQVRKTDVDKFRNYCTRVTDREMKKFEREQKQEMCKKMLPKTATSAPNLIKFVEDIKIVGGTNPLEPFISTPNIDEEESENEKSRSNDNKDILSQLHDETVLIDKIEVNEDPSKDMEQAMEIINLMNIEPEFRGVVENVYRVKTKKGTGLIVKVDSFAYREHLIKQYRSQRSSTTARLKKPKGKELKQIVSLVEELLIEESLEEESLEEESLVEETV